MGGPVIAPCASVTTDTARSVKPHTLLVVDDDPEIRMLLSDLFSREGFRVEVADDGAAAILFLEQHEPPSVILLDILMPASWARACSHISRASPTSSTFPSRSCRARRTSRPAATSCSRSRCGSRRCSSLFAALAGATGPPKLRDRHHAPDVFARWADGHASGCSIPAVRRLEAIGDRLPQQRELDVLDLTRHLTQHDEARIDGKPAAVLDSVVGERAVESRTRHDHVDMRTAAHERL